MKFNFQTTIDDLDGNPVLNPETGGPFTMQTACQMALLAQVDPNFRDAAAKNERFKLAARIADNPSACELKSEEITEIKTAVGELYGPLFVGRVVQMLEDGGALVEKAD